MTSKMIRPFLIGSAGLLACAGAQAVAATPQSADAEAVRKAVLDYVEAVYEAAPDRIARSVAPELNKYGVAVRRDGQAQWMSMNHAQLMELARNYTRNRPIPATAPKAIKILDMGTRIANAKLDASWGTDYLLLTKDLDGTWRIRQVLWEGIPPAPPAK